jgi:uncharacterized protein
MGESKQFLHSHDNETVSDTFIIMNDRIPTYEECIALIAEQGMRENIKNHSIMVMKVALAIADNLLPGAIINRSLVLAGALLHDITKTQALVTHERHDVTGGEFLRMRGFESTAVAVEEHVAMKGFNAGGPVLEKEIVHYADKRVLHDGIVNLDQRLEDLLVRYGTTEEHRSRILARAPFNKILEQKIQSRCSRSLEEIIAEIR